METTITAKGQITIPKAAREHLKVKAGDKVRIFLHPDGHVVVRPVIPVSALRGLLKSRRRKPPTIEEMDLAIRDAVVERYRRATGK
jgi:AbrB family looped-hinge helix DNA binding protein